MNTRINLNPAKVTRTQKAVAYLRREPRYRSLAAMLATMRVVNNPHVPTARTDAISLVEVNEDYMEELNDTRTAAAVLVHETLHKFNMIQLRFEEWVKQWPGHQNPKRRAELAMEFCRGQDYLINHSIKHDWLLPLPEIALYDPQYNMRDYTTESLATKFCREKGYDQPGSQGGGQGQGQGQGDDSSQATGDGAGGNSGGQGNDPNQQGDSGSGSGQGDQPNQQGQGGGSGSDTSDQNGSSGNGSGESEQQSNQQGQGNGSGTGQGGAPERGSGGLHDGNDVLPPPSNDPEGMQDKPMSESQQAEMRAQIQKDIANAVRAAKGIGVDDSDFFHKQMTEKLKAPTASLRKELQRLASIMCRSGHTSWMVPNRKRKLPNGLPMPGPRDNKLGTVIFAIDTSGSTQGETVAYFINTAVKTIQEVAFDELIILHCDTRLRFGEAGKVLRYTKNQAKPGRVDTNAYGGGGTKFSPVFDWVKANVRGKVSALVYLTDGGTMHSDVKQCERIWKQKRYPVLWALAGQGPWVDTFINWVTVDSKFGRASRLPEKYQ